MIRSLSNILWLGLKELQSLRHDTFLLAFVVYSFTFAVYSHATGVTHNLRNAAIAVVDEDRSTLSARIADAFLAPAFQSPDRIAPAEMSQGMDAAHWTFVLDIPPDFERDVRAGRQPLVQLNVDATAMLQAGIGAGIIERIVTEEVARGTGGEAALRNAAEPVALQLRVAFNQALDSARFSGAMAIVSNVTMLSVLLAGAALIREREHGTIDHLLAMPLTPIEIMLAKLWANGLVILTAVSVSLIVVLGWAVGVKPAGSIPLFLAGTTLYLFFATSLGIFLGTVARSMPQLGLLFILTVLPMNMLSGADTPIESMPLPLQFTMQLVPSTHFVSFAQAILFRGADLAIVWPHFLATGAVGTAFLAFGLSRFRRALAT
ncbi:ABC transporter permease [Falsiroseomonas sp. HC035]|uniref:ABC transporter permease n=1 Tax=Falsiroseomonas sp. HC035 TaxID=3390999 RepID=UPI003D3101ED